MINLQKAIRHQNYFPRLGQISGAKNRSHAARVIAPVVLAAILFSACTGQPPPAVTFAPIPSVLSPTSLVVFEPSQTPVVPPTELPVATSPAVEPTSVVYNDPSYYYGGLRITLDNVGQEITLKKRQGFMLDLGDDYTWVVIAAPETVLSRNMNYTPQPGEQGIFIARGTGKAELSATGDPKCLLSNPPCARPSVLFRIAVVVE